MTENQESAPAGNVVGLKGRDHEQAIADAVRPTEGPSVWSVPSWEDLPRCVGCGAPDARMDVGIGHRNVRFQHYLCSPCAAMLRDALTAKFEEVNSDHTT